MVCLHRCHLTERAATAAAGDAPAVAAGSGVSTGGGLDDETSPDAGGRWHNSTLQLDQSATTQTLHVGDDYQSADPTYELWLAVKPRILFVRDAPSIA